MGGAEHPVLASLRVPLSAPLAVLGLASCRVLLCLALTAFFSITVALWRVTLPLAFAFAFTVAFAPPLACSFAFLAVIRK